MTIRRLGLTLTLASLFMLVSCNQGDRNEVDETVRPHIAESMPRPAILAFSKTSGWRHKEGIAGADRFFSSLAEAKSYGFYATENAAIFNAEDLARFDVVIFNNVTGDVLNTQQETAFETWLAKGGGWIGLHGAGDGSQASWTWYQQDLVGPKFIGHTMGPQFQEARVVGLAKDHPVMAGLPSEWTMQDEWYSFASVPQVFDMTPIVGLDEASYSPMNTVVKDWPEDLRMGAALEDHPIVWTHCADEARTVYTAIGHTQYVYDDATYQKLLTNALEWAMHRSDPENKGCEN